MKRKLEVMNTRNELVIGKSTRKLVALLLAFVYFSYRHCDFLNGVRKKLECARNMNENRNTHSLKATLSLTLLLPNLRDERIYRNIN